MAIGESDASKSLGLLALTVFLGGLLFSFNWLKYRRIFIKHSAFFISIFYFYFVLRIILDIGDIGRLKAYTIATTGGTLLFYLLGVLFAIILDRILSNALLKRTISKLTVGLSLAYFLITTFYLTNATVDFLSILRIDKFLISGTSGDYQRPGDFLIIQLIIFSVLLIYISILNKEGKNFCYQFANFFHFVLYFFQIFLLICLSQLMGSNKALALTVTIGFITISIYFMLLSHKVVSYFKEKTLTFRTLLFGKMTLKFITIILISSLFMTGLIWSLVSIGGIDISRTRIMNYGQGGVPSSVTSRIRHTRNNFFDQFSYDPVFGNMNVHIIKKGVYVHSFLGSSLTHLGLLGTFMFLTYLGIAIKAFFIKRSQYTLGPALYFEKIIKLHSMLIFGSVFFLATIGTFINWSVFWFAMGMFTNPIRFRALWRKFPLVTG